MFSTDKPITDASEDKLGRSGFAERLAKAIINFDTADSYAILQRTIFFLCCSKTRSGLLRYGRHNGYKGICTDYL